MAPAKNDGNPSALPSGAPLINPVLHWSADELRQFYQSLAASHTHRDMTIINPLNKSKPQSFYILPHGNDINAGSGIVMNGTTPSSSMERISLSAFIHQKMSLLNAQSDAKAPSKSVNTIRYFVGRLQFNVQILAYVASKTRMTLPNIDNGVPMRLAEIMHEKLLLATNGGSGDNNGEREFFEQIVLKLHPPLPIEYQQQQLPPTPTPEAPALIPAATAFPNSDLAPKRPKRRAMSAAGGRTRGRKTTATAAALNLAVANAAWADPLDKYTQPPLHQQQPQQSTIIARKEPKISSDVAKVNAKMLPNGTNQLMPSTSAPVADPVAVQNDSVVEQPTEKDEVSSQRRSKRTRAPNHTLRDFQTTSYRTNTKKGRSLSVAKGKLTGNRTAGRGELQDDAASPAVAPVTSMMATMPAVLPFPSASTSATTSASNTGAPNSNSNTPPATAANAALADNIARLDINATIDDDACCTLRDFNLISLDADDDDDNDDADDDDDFHTPSTPPIVFHNTISTTNSPSVAAPAAAAGGIPIRNERATLLCWKMCFACLPPSKKQQQQQQQQRQPQRSEKQLALAATFAAGSSSAFSIDLNDVRFRELLFGRQSFPAKKSAAIAAGTGSSRDNDNINKSSLYDLFRDAYLNKSHAHERDAYFFGTMRVSLPPVERLLQWLRFLFQRLSFVTIESTILLPKTTQQPRKLIALVVSYANGIAKEIHSLTNNDFKVQWNDHHKQWQYEMTSVSCGFLATMLQTMGKNLHDNLDQFAEEDLRQIMRHNGGDDDVMNVGITRDKVLKYGFKFVQRYLSAFQIWLQVHYDDDGGGPARGGGGRGGTAREILLSLVARLDAKFPVGTDCGGGGSAAVDDFEAFEYYLTQNEPAAVRQRVRTMNQCRKSVFDFLATPVPSSTSGGTVGASLTRG